MAGKSFFGNERPPKIPDKEAHETMSCACNSCSNCSNNHTPIQAYTSTCPGSCLQLTNAGYTCQNSVVAGASTGFNCNRWCRRWCGDSVAGTDTGVGCSCRS